VGYLRAESRGESTGALGSMGTDAGVRAGTDVGSTTGIATTVLVLLSSVTLAGISLVGVHLLVPGNSARVGASGPSSVVLAPRGVSVTPRTVAIAPTAPTGAGSAREGAKPVASSPSRGGVASLLIASHAAHQVVTEAVAAVREVGPPIVAIPPVTPLPTAAGSPAPNQPVVRPLGDSYAHAAPWSPAAWNITPPTRSSHGNHQHGYDQQSGYGAGRRHSDHRGPRPASDRAGGYSGDRGCASRTGVWRTGQHSRTGQHGGSNEQGQPGRTSQHGQPGRPAGTNEHGHTGHHGQPGQHGQHGHTGQHGQPGQGGHTGRYGH
jgi:hypothetical protein